MTQKSSHNLPSKNMFKDPHSAPASKKEKKQLFSKFSRYKILRQTNIDTHHLLWFSLTAFIVLSLLSHTDQLAFALNSNKTLESIDQILARKNTLLNDSPAMALLSAEEQLKPFSTSLYDIQPQKKHLDSVSLASQIITEPYSSKDSPSEEAEIVLKKLAMTNTFKPTTQGFFESALSEDSPFKLSLPVKHFRITSRYGWRHGRPHRGVDLSAPIGTTVYASEEGTVIMAEPYYGYGNLVVIDHGNGVRTRYAHLAKIFVQEGAKVFKDQMVGSIGMTGSTTGPHLHFEVVQNSHHKNPELFLFQ